MGSSSSKSQANQSATTVSNDDKIANDSGIVARDSSIDLSSYWSQQNTTSNVAETTLSNYDSRDMSTSYSDNSNRSTSNWLDNSDRSTSNFFDASDRSTSSTSNWLDASDRSTSSSLTNNTSTSSSTSLSNWDASVKNTSSNTNTDTTTGSYNTTTTADPEIARAAFDFATNNDVMLGQGLDRMLGFASELTNKTQDSATGLAARFQDSVMQAFDSGRNTTPGGIDNKTMIVLGVAGAAAIAMMARKGN